MGVFTLHGSDEFRHLPGTDREWGESWYHDFAASDGSSGGWLRLGLYPNLGVAWYWAAFVRAGRPLVLLSDVTAPCPDRAGSSGPVIEVAHGGWTTRWECAEELQSWRITGTGTARTYADPADVFVADHPGDGDVEVHYDLEWRGAAPVYPYPVTTRYEQSAWINGSVVIDGEALDVYCPGQRDHSWGNRVWSAPWLWTSGHLTGGPWFHGVRILLPGASTFQIGYVVRPDHDLAATDRVDVAYTVDADELPTSLRVRVDGLELTVTPELHAPVMIDSPDGVPSRFPRCVARFEDDRGNVGRGWVEFNFPAGGDRLADTFTG